MMPGILRESASLNTGFISIIIIDILIYAVNELIISVIRPLLAQISSKYESNLVKLCSVCARTRRTKTNMAAIVVEPPFSGIIVAFYASRRGTQEI